MPPLPQGVSSAPIRCNALEPAPFRHAQCRALHEAQYA
jgi:hypothetical protein